MSHQCAQKKEFEATSTEATEQGKESTHENEYFYRAKRPPREFKIDGTVIEIPFAAKIPKDAWH